MLLSITISVSLGPSLLPWTITEVNEDTYTFEALFTMAWLTCCKGPRAAETVWQVWRSPYHIFHA